MRLALSQEHCRKIEINYCMATVLVDQLIIFLVV